MIHHWLCLHCPAHGTHDDPGTKTDTAPPAKHVGPKGEPHATVTTTHAGLAARLGGAR